MKTQVLALLISLICCSTATGGLVYEIVGGTSIPRSLTDRPGDPGKARAVIIERSVGNCLACHQIPALDDVPFHGDVGPSLANVANRYSEGELRLLIVNPKARFPDTMMPAFYRKNGFFRVLPKHKGKTILTAGQVEDVVAFLLTLKNPKPAAPVRAMYNPGAIVPVRTSVGSPLPKLISGYYFQIAETQEMQDDDLLNPAFFGIDLAQERWNAIEGKTGKSCASCHDAVESSMRGVGAGYPKYRAASSKVVNLEQQINICRDERMQAEPWKFNSRELLTMTVLVKYQSRGMPVNVHIGGDAAPFFERGKTHFYRRRGQLDMSCAHCHDQRNGKLLRGDLVSQGHTNAYPIYALGDSSERHLHKLIWHCNDLMRSTPFDFLSDEYVNLELFLAWRGQGLPVEVPGVRW